MTISRKAVGLLPAAITAAACGLAACDKGPGKAGAGSAAHSVTTATATDTDKASAAQLQAPPLPDPSRTDPEAVAMRKKYVDWRVAQVKAANDAAQKQTEQFYGSGAPKGNYGRMADGLPKLADHN